MVLTRPALSLSSDFSQLLTPTTTPSASPHWAAPAMSNEGLVIDLPVHPHRSDAFLVLWFNERGQHSYKELSRSEILHIIRQAELTPNDDKPLPDTATPREKRSGSGVSPLGAFCDLQPVHMRDLRQLDESFNASNETSIVVRKQAVLINADPIRSIITRNATMVFVPDGADSLLLMLMNDFEECVQKQVDSPTAYEFKALEALLDTLSRTLNDEYDLHAAELNEVLDSLIKVSIMSGELETMRLMKNSMSAFEAQVDSIRRALMELLDNEEDLRLLYLTKDIYTTRTKSELLQHRVQTTESLITMKLDYARNYLLALQLIFSLVGVGLGVGTLISGIFGMNLKIDAPTNSAATFWWVIGVILVGCVIVIWGGIVYFRRQGLLIAT